MISARLSTLDENGNTNVIIGLSVVELIRLMDSEEPVLSNLEHVGIPLNIIVIARKTNDELIDAVKNVAEEDEDVKLVALKPSDKEKLEVLLMAKRAHDKNCNKHDYGNKRRPSKKRR